MPNFKRYEKNPFFKPDENNFWEQTAAFNGCPVKDENKYHLLYRALSGPAQYKEINNMRLSTIGYANSDNGVDFSNKKQLITPEYDWEAYGCEDPRIVKNGNEYFIFYTALSGYPFSNKNIKVGLAITKDFETFKKYPVTTFNAKAMSLFPEKVNGQYVAILTADTDQPPGKIALAYFDKKTQIWSKKYWDEWYASIDTHIIPLMRSPLDHIELGAPPVKTEYGWVVIYSYIKNYLGSQRVFGIEAVLLDLEDPSKVLGRTHGPILKPETKEELFGDVPDIVFPSGALLEGDDLVIYYGAADTVCSMARGKLKDLIDDMCCKRKPVFLSGKEFKDGVKRSDSNPIMEPRTELAWEAKAVFNPAAVYVNDKVHIVYRAMSNINTSVMGYAVSSDGVNIDERLNEPIYTPRENFEQKLGSPTGNSGCEDGRITEINGVYYMFYTAYDGVNPPRVALSSISKTDFLNRKWNKWKKPILISPPGIDDKDACVLPKKIDGKFAIFHRIDNDISISYVKDLNFKDHKWVLDEPVIMPRPDRWDNRKVGISSVPIETKKGWLLLYHGISDPGGVYKVGAALLDLKNPKKVLSRTERPIFVPEESYEKQGLVPNVVFPCGSVVIKDEIYIYYGGADKVLGVAKIALDNVLKRLS